MYYTVSPYNGFNPHQFPKLKDFDYTKNKNKNKDVTSYYPYPYYPYPYYLHSYNNNHTNYNHTNYNQFSTKHLIPIKSFGINILNTLHGKYVLSILKKLYLYGILARIKGGWCRDLLLNIDNINGDIDIVIYGLNLSNSHQLIDILKYILKEYNYTCDTNTHLIYNGIYKINIFDKESNTNIKIDIALSRLIDPMNPNKYFDSNNITQDNESRLLGINKFEADIDLANLENSSIIIYGPSDAISDLKNRIIRINFDNTSTTLYKTFEQKSLFAFRAIYYFELTKFTSIDINIINAFAKITNYNNKISNGSIISMINKLNDTNFISFIDLIIKYKLTEFIRKKSIDIINIKYKNIKNNNTQL